MSKLFGNLTDEGMEQAEDRLGGFQPLASGAYEATIKAMYAGEAQSGARNVTIIADVDGQEFRETIYITNKKGENFYMTKNDKKAPLPGFTTVDHLCLVATGKSLAEQDTEDKMVNIYDRDAGKELPKSVPMLVDCLGQTVGLAILRVLENKNEKQGNEYVPTAETREYNSIDKVFDVETQMTVVEALNGENEAVFIPAWTEKNADEIRDKREIRDGASGARGNSGGASGRPAANDSKPARKSLFGNKEAA